MRRLSPALALLFCLMLACTTPQLEIMTVRGPLAASEMGTTLIHEHVFLDWIPADSQDINSWNEEEAFRTILPRLRELDSHEVQTFFDCTPAWLGRNPNLLKRLSEASGIHMLTNTGYYGARKNRYIPSNLHEQPVAEWVEKWTQEAREGIEGTGIRPGFIKISVDADSPLSKLHQNLVRAAARVHKQTGLSIVSHTGPDVAALQQLRILAEEGVGAEAFVWTHAQRGTSQGHIEAAQRGAWISLDGMGWMAADSSTRESAMTPARYIALIRNLKNANLLDHVLISHDAGWYTHGDSAGGSYRPHTDIFTRLIPAMDTLGFSRADVEQMLIHNPREAYAIRVRPRMY